MDRLWWIQSLKVWALFEIRTKKLVHYDCRSSYFKFENFDQVYSNTRVSTQVNTSQHESTRVNTSLTRINTSPTKVNTNQHESDTSQHVSTSVRHESAQIIMSPTQVNTNQHEPTSRPQKERINMAKQNANVTHQWCFLEKYVQGWIYQWFKFSSPIYFQLYHQVLLFYKGIYFINHHVIVKVLTL